MICLIINAIFVKNTEKIMLKGGVLQCKLQFSE